MRNSTFCGELIVNGEFDAGFTAWTVSAGGTQQPTVVDGYAVLATSDTISQIINTVAGTELTLSYECSGLNDATGEINVVSQPSNTRLLSTYDLVDQSGVVITVPDGETGVKVSFSCYLGGEVHVDNVSLLPVNGELIIGGDFSDASLPGWTASAGTTETPQAVDGHLQLPDASAVTQYVTVTAGCTLSLSYSMQLLYSAQGNVTVTALTSGDVLYTHNESSSVSNATFIVPDGETTVSVVFACTLGGEVDVDNVSMVYA